MVTGIENVEYQYAYVSSYRCIKPRSPRLGLKPNPILRTRVWQTIQNENPVDDAPPDPGEDSGAVDPPTAIQGYRRWLPEPKEWLPLEEDGARSVIRAKADPYKAPRRAVSGQGGLKGRQQQLLQFHKQQNPSLNLMQLARALPSAKAPSQQMAAGGRPLRRMQLLNAQIPAWASTFNSVTTSNTGAMVSKLKGVGADLTQPAPTAPQPPLLAPSRQPIPSGAAPAKATVAAKVTKAPPFVGVRRPSITTRQGNRYLHAGRGMLVRKAPLFRSQSRPLANGSWSQHGGGLKKSVTVSKPGIWNAFPGGRGLAEDVEIVQPASPCTSFGGLAKRLDFIDADRGEEQRQEEVQEEGPLCFDLLDDVHLDRDTLPSPGLPLSASAGVQGHEGSTTSGASMDDAWAVAPTKKMVVVGMVSFDAGIANDEVVERTAVQGLGLSTAVPGYAMTCSGVKAIHGTRAELEAGIDARKVMGPCVADAALALLQLAGAAVDNDGLQQSVGTDDPMQNSKAIRTRTCDSCTAAVQGGYAVDTAGCDGDGDDDDEGSVVEGIQGPGCEVEPREEVGLDPTEVMGIAVAGASVKMDGALVLADESRQRRCGTGTEAAWVGLCKSAPAAGIANEMTDARAAHAGVGAHMLHHSLVMSSDVLRQQRNMHELPVEGVESCKGDQATTFGMQQRQHMAQHMHVYALNTAPMPSPSTVSLGLCQQPITGGGSGPKSDLAVPLLTAPPPHLPSTFQFSVPLEHTAEVTHADKVLSPSACTWEPAAAPQHTTPDADTVPSPVLCCQLPAVLVQELEQSGEVSQGVGAVRAVLVIKPTESPEAAVQATAPPAHVRSRVKRQHKHKQVDGEQFSGQPGATDMTTNVVGMDTPEPSTTLVPAGASEQVRSAFSVPRGCGLAVPQVMVACGTQLPPSAAVLKEGMMAPASAVRIVISSPPPEQKGKERGKGEKERKEGKKRGRGEGEKQGYTGLGRHMDPHKLMSFKHAARGIDWGGMVAMRAQGLKK